ncbi:MAG: Asp-tRNA(Asn)/Glu-tRNA(Gln) amidotransferase subunit GatB [Oscillospiraceae bacterium]|nr:Asp-tRNA(Asn)/Glu-tRNA(Gln) amidotransferase subunit GatB [Oscillospiraceae bacterium]
MREYEMVAGLETHVELATKTKIFCGCTTAFGGAPNTHCCPICIGLPGVLPKLNRQVVRYGILAGLATNCKINPVSKMDRKNYVYPDLPKAYQVSQYDKPLCLGGWITLDSGKKIRLTRIHIEEDAGKLVHERGDTFVDYNRGGVPLIEVVTEPDFRSVEEVREYVEKLQLLMKYIGVSDCKMQEGSLRCDVNISVRPKGSETFGTRTEIKNMNSFTFMSKALEYEFERQVDLLESGEAVIQETRRYNDTTGETESMRSKEDAHDYRYFKEPDLVTIATGEEEIETLRAQLPELPDRKKARYLEMGINEGDAAALIRSRRAAAFFDEAAEGLNAPKTAAAFIVGQMFSRYSTEEQREEWAVAISPAQLHALCELVESGKCNRNLAKATLEKMLDTGKDAKSFLSEGDLAGVGSEQLAQVCKTVIAQNAGAVQNYLGGKETALKALVGAVMRETRGRADAEKASGMLIDMLKKEC